MDAGSQAILRGALDLCIRLYGADETRSIMAEVNRRIEATGLDGAFLRDWLIFIKQVSIARHPDTADIWGCIDMEKSNDLPTH
jgi:hypothetical protein